MSSSDMGVEYRDDIFHNLKHQEHESPVDPDMIDLQPEVEWYMRPYLLDFLIDAHYSLRLSPETLHRAVNLIDSYCSLRVVFKKHYQLVGCTALWTASKFEDKKSRTPSIKELRSLCCGAYEEDMFIQMENHILTTLDWNVSLPTAETFLSICGCDSGSGPVLDVARYLCESALFHRVFIGTKPSLLATCAYSLANYVVNYIPPAALSSSQHLHLMNLMIQHIQAPSRSLAKKYAKSAYSQAAHLVQAFLQRQAVASTTISLPPTPPPPMDAVPPSLSSSPATSVFTPQPQSPVSSLNGCVDGVRPKPADPAGCMTPPYTPVDACLFNPVPPRRQSFANFPTNV